MQVCDTELSLMVPHADLANHAFQPNAIYALRASQGVFELRSCTPIAKGQPICITYGTDKTNAELMRDYGFVVPGNPNDRLDFTCTSLQQQPAVLAKPARFLFKALNAAPAPVSREQQPQLLAGPLLAALGLTGKVEAGKLRPEGMSGQEVETACQKDAALSRKLAAVLSLPVQDSAQAAQQAGGNSFWPPKAWTDSGIQTHLHALCFMSDICPLPPPLGWGSPFPPSLAIQSKQHSRLELTAVDFPKLGQTQVNRCMGCF